ncbi:MAG: SDR family oxidoreductase, partial [Spirochaetaceae bacterium]|nr:SDR family oxidoreductase [Spirochaetaceae bacterium]
YGNWALITGASAGIGKAYAEAMASEGLNLVLVARREDELKKIASDLKQKNGIEVKTVALDLSKDGFMSELSEKTGNQEIDILVNNAGFGTSGYFHEIDGQKEETMVKLNCLAPVILTRHYMKGMLERNKGALIMLSSIAANQPSPHGVTYAATKVFDLFLGEGLHHETRKTGVDVLSVKPGATTTEFQKVADYKAIKGSRSAEQVVKTSLKNLGRRRAVTDGFSNKMMGFMAGILPRTLVINMAAQWAESNRNKDA